MHVIIFLIFCGHTHNNHARCKKNLTKTTKIKNIFSFTQRQRRGRSPPSRPAATTVVVVRPGRRDAAQDRGDGRGAGGQVVADHAVPVPEVLVQVQADRGGDAPRPVHGGRRENRPGHTGHFRCVRVPGHARPVHIVGGRFRAGLLRHRSRFVPAGGRHQGPDHRDQAHGRRADRGGRQQARLGQFRPEGKHYIYHNNTYY